MPQKYPLPAAWRDRVVSHAHAMSWGKVELTANRGQYCDYLARQNDGTPGDYWCMHFVCECFHGPLRAASPLLKSGSCEQQRQRAIARGARRTRADFDAARRSNPLAVAGWVGLVIGPDDAGRPHAHHTFIVGMLTDAGEITVTGPRGGVFTCEGNAADPHAAASRNGDGAYSGRERAHRDDTGQYEFIDPAALASA